MLCMPMSHGSRRAPFTHWKGRPRLCLRYGPRAHPSGFPSMSRLPSSLHSATSRLPVRSIPLPRGVTLAAFISASQLSEFQLSVVYVARSPPAPFSFQLSAFGYLRRRPTTFYFVSCVRGPSALRQKCRRGALRPSRTCPCYTPRGAGHDRSRPLGTAESSTGAPWLPSVSSRRCSGLD